MRTSTLCLKASHRSKKISLRFLGTLDARLGIPAQIGIASPCRRTLLRRKYSRLVELCGPEPRRRNAPSRWVLKAILETLRASTRGLALMGTSGSASWSCWLFEDVEVLTHLRDSNGILAHPRWTTPTFGPFGCIDGSRWPPASARRCSNPSLS